MKKKKTLLIVIISLIVILLIVGGVLAYLFLATDMFSTNKELFAKYTGQVLEQDGFFPQSLETYENRKDTTPYQSNGTISATTELLGDLATNTEAQQNLQPVLNAANNTNITFTGRVDKANSKVEEDIQVNYSDTTNYPIKYKQDGDRYGILLNEVSQTSYLAVDNNNLKTFLGNMGMDTTNFPDKIEMTTIESLNFTDEEKTHINDTYITPLFEGLSEDKFTKTENDDGTVSYTLTLTVQEVGTMLSQSLQTLSTDTVMIDKINAIGQEIYNESISASIYNEMQTTSIYGGTTTGYQNITSEDILNLKSEIDSNLENMAGAGNFNITVTESDRLTNKIAVELVAISETSSGSTTGYDTLYNTAETITGVNSSTTTSYNDLIGPSSDDSTITDQTTTNTNTTTTPTTTDSSLDSTNSETHTLLLEMEKTQNEGNLTYAITLSVDEQTYVTLNLGYTGLNTDSVTEDINAIITIPETSTSTYSYNKTVAFGQVDIASFDESTIVLNNYSAEQVSALLQQVSMAVVQTNSSLMTQIGFDANEYGNPLLMWFTAPGLATYMQANASISVNDTSMAQEEVNVFNAQFTSYEGQISGANVLTLCDTVANVNLTNTDGQMVNIVYGSPASSTSFITSVADPEVIKESIQSTSNYTVSLSYDATTGKVCEIGIVPASGTIGLTSDSDTNTVGTGTTNTVSTNTVGTGSIGY